jgi:hypothetical protein
VPWYAKGGRVYDRSMAYFTVPIKGDRDQGARLLALNGIQNLVGEDGGLVARLAAPDEGKARLRVVASLNGDFEVGDAEQED